MGGGFTPYLPPQYYQRLKNRAWRLFGKKITPEMREDIIQRASIRHGQIRSRLASQWCIGILKELYTEDCLRGLVHSRNPLLEALNA